MATGKTINISFELEKLSSIVWVFQSQAINID